MDLPCVAVLGLMLLVPAASGDAADDGSTPPAEFGFEPTADGVRQCLARLTPDEEALQQIAALIGQLDDDNYFTRERASRQLARLPAIPLATLAGAMRHPSFEVRCRARRLAVIHSSQRPQAVLKAVLGTVVEQQLEGLAPSILEAMQHYPDAPVWELAQQAVSVTARPEDEPLLRKAVADPAALVRVCAARGLIKILGEKVAEPLLPLAKDPDERIRLLAATTLGNLGHRGCLMPFAEMLRGERFHVRFRSREALRSLTEQNFGYNPGADPAARNAAADRWVAWIRAHGDTVALKFPIRPSKEIALFSGVDLEGWQVVQGGQPVDDQTAWTAKDGVLVCNGGPQGYLRTKEAFTDYTLSLQWRLPNTTSDSGVGLMMTGPDRVAPSCLEVQIRAANAGDLYRIGAFHAAAAGQKISFRSSKFNPSNEKPSGEWNTMEILVAGGEVEVKINGLVQNKAAGCTRKPGKINLRNEGSPIEFRNILLLPLEG